jgi:outer membrane protein assembly factor BamB
MCERRHAVLHAMVAMSTIAAGAPGCAVQDPRIVAAFKQNAGTYAYSTRTGGAYYYYNSPTVVGGHVYIGTSRRLNDSPGPDNFFFRLDAGLKKVWEYPLGEGEVRGGATLDAEGRIYFVVEKGRKLGDASDATDELYCLSNDGNLLWTFPITAGRYDWQADANALGMFNPAVAEDGTVYVGGGKLYALRWSGAGPVTVAWSFPAAGDLDIKNAPIIDREGNVYFNGSGVLYSLRPGDGSMRWSFQGTDTWSESLSSPAFSFDEARVYSAMGRSVHCIDAATGSRIWSFTPPGVAGDFRATPAVDDEGNVYAATKANADSALYAIRADGTLLWENRLGTDLYSSPALGNDRTLYVGSESTDKTISGYASGDLPRFHAIDMATGATRWSVKLPGMGDVTWSSPALVEGGVVYVGSMNGNVYAIRSDATGLLPGAGSPRFHGGNASTGRRE